MTDSSSKGAEMDIFMALEIEFLLDEISRYLDAVDAFRGEGCAPSWHAEALR
jgi:hypothetical protein